MALRPTYGRVWAEAGARTDLGAEKYRLGWVGEIPTYEALNFLQYRIDLGMVASMERGVPEWGGDIAYVAGALAWDNTNGTIYRAKVANPSKTKAPSANLDQWEISSAQYTMTAHNTMVASFNGHIARTDNPHGVTAQQAGTYTRAVIDQKVTAATDNLEAHKARRDNPHGVTAEQAGGVPKTGGTYTGPVTFAAQETLINPSAGDTAIRSSSYGVSLRVGTDFIGVARSQKRAFFETAGQVQWLMNEPEYVAHRKTIEHTYAVPTPDFEIDGLSDIHIKHGFGYSDFVRPVQAQYTDKSGIVRTAPADMPRHEQNGLMLYADVGERFTFDADLNIAGVQDATIFIEGVWQQPAGEQYCHVYMDNSAARDTIFISPTGGVSVKFLNSAGAVVQRPIGQVYDGVPFKIVVSWGVQTVRGYVDGVKGNQFDMSFTLTNSYTTVTLGRDESDPSPQFWWFRAIKIWHRVLTDQQVSTL